MKAEVTPDESPADIVLSPLAERTTKSVQLHPNIIASTITNHSSTKLSQQRAKFAAYEKIVVIEIRSLTVKLLENFNMYRLKLWRKPTQK